MNPALARAASAQRAGRLDEAARLIDTLLATDPDNIDACHIGGALALQRGDFQRAVALGRRFRDMRPDLGAAAALLGHALLANGAPGEALTAFRRAIDAHPGDALALGGMAASLRALGRLDEAITAYSDAHAANPADARTLSNLGVTLQQAGDLDGARDALESAVALAPDLPEAHKNLAILDLLAGDFATGFDGLTWRWREQKTHNRRRPFMQPDWDGADLAQQILLVWGEQGIGDEIMFASLLPEVIAEARGCIVECAPRLTSLFVRSFSGAHIISRSDPPHAATENRGITAQCAAGDLCRWRRRSRAAFPAPTAYLRADGARAETLRARYRGLGSGPLIGIAWASKTPHWGGIKSAGLDLWHPILSLTGAVFVSLQYGDHAPEIAAARARFKAAIHVDETIDQMNDLDGFAAQIAALDAVVTISGTTAHMAGALGIPSHVLLAKVPDWRWQLSDSQALWYPRHTLHRQQIRGDWSHPIAAAAARLSGPE